MKLNWQGFAAVAAAAALAGCAADGSLQTASISTPQTSTVATADPVCTALANQIDLLRKEGSVEALEKAADGKGKSVKVKREALAKQAELNRVNADFQSKCGPKLPAVQSAQAAPAAATAQVAPVQAAAAAKKQ